MKRAFLVPFVLFFLSVLVATVPLGAQEFRGAILGRITDPSGAVLPGAKIIVLDEQTNVRVEAQSNDEGNYLIPFLLPGRYTVTVEASGFKKAVREKVIVQVQDRIALNFSLELGPTTTSVTVTAESPMLQTANADMGQVVDRHFVDRLPVGRSPLDYADMAPGVLAEGSGFPGVTSNGQNDITINGGNGDHRGNDVTVDGVPALAPRQLGLAVGVPMSDAVQEFKVQTTMFDASLGRSNGGALAITTRSGTNTYHGSGYYYLQNRALNANSWTNNRVALPKPPLKVRSWGGTFGGPVRLPKYNGRDRTFFFFGFERDVNGRSTPALARVPTELERQGDFSQTLAPRGAPLALFDPYSTVLNPQGGFVSRTAFPGARIPSDRLNPAGLAVLALYPRPNLSGGPQLGRPNWAASTNYTTDVQNVQARVDQQISSRQRIFVRFSALDHLQSPTPNFFPGAYFVQPNGTSNINLDNRRQKSLALDDTITFTPTFIGSFRLGYTRLFSKVRMDGDGRDPALLKLPAALIGAQTGGGWPIFDVRADGGAYGTFIGSRPRQSVNDVWALLANLNKLQGNHTFKFGVDYRLIRWNEANPGEQANGQFVFNNTLTRANPLSAATGDTSGSAMASLLLGLPATTSNSRIGAASDLSLQSQYLALFFQDDFKVSRRLTLNLGLRYELETPFTERYNRLLYGFDPNADLKLSVPALGALKGGVLFVNNSGLERRQGQVDGNNFGPRVGFAFSLNDATVLRGGYGIFFSSGVNNVSGGAPSTDPSFGATTPYVGSSNRDVTPLPGVSLGNPFPAGLVRPTGSSLGFLTDLGSVVTFVQPERVLPYVQQWQFGVQRQLPWHALFEVAYVGSHSVRIHEDFNLNEIPDAYLKENQSVPNPFLGVLPASSTLGQGSSISANKLRVRFPQFNTVNIQRANTARMLYHALQTRLQKRLSHGLTLVTNYTWSKSLFYRAFSQVNERHYRTVGPYDRTHLFRLFLTYDLPVGRGRAYGSGWPGWLDKAIGNWSVTWVARYTGGAPLEITDTRGRPIPIRDPQTSGSVQDRLGDRLDPGTKLPVNPYIDPNAFVRLPDEFTVTPEPPRYSWLRGPGRLAHTLTVFKDITVFERLKMQLRGEVANPFNSPQFDDPATNLASPATFGVITSAGGARSVMLGVKLTF